MNIRNDKTEITGLIIITHSNYGEALLRAAETILGPIGNSIAMSVDITADVKDTVDNLRKTAEQLDMGNGVLILTDMFGGTPTNLSLSLLSIDGVEVVTGVNLPMILRAASQSYLNAAALAEEARQAGLQGIVSASDMLRQKRG
ncbi:MAG: PTS sugar transporter subunit IIA [Desulfovibrionaceae bacterium]|nr:PTS sugar transporter subunit IIA [Desulfovibrionaceae bacterium]